MKRLLLLALTLVSRLLGYFRSAFTLWLFGSGAVSDGLNAVFALPNGLRKLLSEGSLGQTYALSFSKTDGEDNRFAWAMIIKQWSWSVPLAAAGYLVGPHLASALFPFDSVPAMIIVRDSFGPAFFYLPFAAASSVAAGLLSFRKKNSRLLLGTLSFSIAAILGLYQLSQQKTWNWGWLIALGGAAQFASFMLLAEFWKWPFPQLAKAQKGQVRGWFANLFYHFLPILSFQLLLFFLSAEGEGTVTAFTLEFTLLQVPLGLFIHSQAMETYSRILTGETLPAKGFQDTFSGILPWMCFAGAAVFYFGSDIVSLLFGEPYQAGLQPRFLFPLILGMPGLALSTFLQKIYVSEGLPVRAILFSLLGQTLGFLALFWNPAWVWTAGVSTTAVLLLVPKLLSSSLMHFNLTSLFRGLVVVLVLFGFLYLTDDILSDTTSLVRLFVAGSGGTAFLVGWSYIFRWKEIRFWEEQRS